MNQNRKPTPTSAFKIPRPNSCVETTKLSTCLSVSSRSGYRSCNPLRRSSAQHRSMKPCAVSQVGGGLLQTLKSLFSLISSGDLGSSRHQKAMTPQAISFLSPISQQSIMSFCMLLSSCTLATETRSNGFGEDFQANARWSYPMIFR